MHRQTLPFNVDFINLQAIAQLELLGNLIPTQDEIETMERLISASLFHQTQLFLRSEKGDNPQQGVLS